MSTRPLALRLAGAAALTAGLGLASLGGVASAQETTTTEGGDTTTTQLDPGGDTTTTQLDVGGGGDDTSTTQVDADAGDTSTTQLDVGGGSATTAAPTRVEAGGGGTADDSTLPVSAIAIAGAGIVVVGATAERLRRQTSA